MARVDGGEVAAFHGGTRYRRALSADSGYCQTYGSLGLEHVECFPVTARKITEWSNFGMIAAYKSSRIQDNVRTGKTSDLSTKECGRYFD